MDKPPMSSELRDVAKALAIGFCITAAIVLACIVIYLLVLLVGIYLPAGIVITPTAAKLAFLFALLFAITSAAAYDFIKADSDTP